MRLAFCSTCFDAVEHLSSILYGIIWQYKCYGSNSDSGGIRTATGKTALVQQAIDGLPRRGGRDHSDSHSNGSNDTRRDGYSG
jgi:hypothetical protein